MKLLIIRAVMRVFSWITPRVAEFIAPPIATVLWYLSPRKRRVTRINLRAVYPDMNSGQRDRIARASMTQYVRGAFEVGMLWHWPLDRVLDLFDDAESMELFYQAQRTGSGVILAGAHAGAWELLGFFMQKHINGAILYKPGRHADVEEILLQKRRRAGARLVPATSAGLRTMFKFLKSGHTVALLADQEPTLGEGVFVPYFGIETLTGVLVPRMAQRFGAMVLFVTCERTKGGRYRVHIFKADEAVYGGDMRAAATAVNHGIEQCIEVATEQYLWAYKRFRNRPDGEKPLYKK